MITAKNKNTEPFDPGEIYGLIKRALGNLIYEALNKGSVFAKEKTILALMEKTGVIKINEFKLDIGDKETFSSKICDPLDPLKAIDNAIKMFRIDRAAGNAFNMTSKMKDDNSYFDGMSGYNDALDAFRHAYWSAVMVRDVGYKFAEEAGINHEINRKSKNYIQGENEMDLWNNNVGRLIGQKLKDNGIQDDKEYAEEVFMNMDKLIKSPEEVKK